MRTWFLLSSALACAALGACASINEGEVSFRRAEPPGAVPENAENPPILPARLTRMNTSLADAGVRVKPIQTKDHISIRLDYGFIDGSMTELPFTPDRLWAVEGPFVRRGEVLVLANAFEFPESATDAVAAGDGGDSAAEADRFMFDDASLENARVIFYSNDVIARQSMNFSNIPLLGPIEYHGRPIGIQLIVLELDDTSNQMEGLLSQLADIGKSAATTQGPLADALYSLGSSLLNAASDDILFRYTMVLDPEPVDSGSGRTAGQVSLLEPGRIVFFRREDRGTAVDWSDMRLDHNDGRLYHQHCTGGQTKDCAYYPFVEETYLTLNVLNHGADAPAAAFNYQRLSELRTALNGAQGSRQDLSAISKAIQEDIEAEQAQDATRELGAKVRRVREAYVREYTPLSRRRVAGGLCPGEEDIGLQRASALYSAHNEAISLWRDLKDKYDTLGEANQQYLMSLFADFALGDTAENGFEPSELAAETFETTFLEQDNARDFTARLDAAADARGRTTCPGAPNDDNDAD